MSSSIPSWQILTAHAQPFRGASDLAFCLKVPLDSLLVWASSEGSGETAQMRSLAWTFAARIGYKYQIRLTWSKYTKWCLVDLKKRPSKQYCSHFDPSFLRWRRKKKLDICVWKQTHLSVPWSTQGSFSTAPRHWKLSSIIARPDLKIILTIISRRNLTITSQIAGRGSSIGCASAWYADGRGFDPQVQRTFFRRDLVMKKILRPFSPFRWFKKAVVSYWRKNVH